MVGIDSVTWWFKSCWFLLLIIIENVLFVCQDSQGMRWFKSYPVSISYAVYFFFKLGVTMKGK